MTPQPRYRNLPFLHRNWITGVNHLQAVPNKLAHGTVEREDDHQCLRPAKRRRCADGSPDSGIGDVTGLLPDEPGEIQRALRIEVLRIIHKDSSRVKNNGIFNGNTGLEHSNASNTRARCRITITSKNPGEPRVLHCDSQICTVRTSKNPVGPSLIARVHLPQPFNVPEEKIFVERDDDAVFDLADAYTVSVELESAGDKNWPPLNLESVESHVFATLLPRHWVLRAIIPDILCRTRSSPVLQLKKNLRVDEITNYVMDIDTRWATGLPEKATLKRLEKNVLPEITVFGQMNGSRPSVNGHENGTPIKGRMTNVDHTNGFLSNGDAILVDDDGDEDMGGADTPTRSLRTKNPKNYNLKLLSAQAQGKEPRKRQKLAEVKKLDSDLVVYLLPKLPEPVRQLVVDGFACCICHATNQSIIQLRAHLMSHSQYEFDFDVVDGHFHFVVSFKAGTSASPTRSRIYQLGRPRGILDLHEYVRGDDSWVTSRYGPQNDALQKAPQTQVKAPPKSYARRKEKPKPLLVPATKQPLYDPLSKAELVPGTEIRHPVADDTWLIQKHRDTLLDFSDLELPEKEYMREWDAFIIKKRISSDAYVARAFLEFVKEKAQWLVASQSRVEEFGKHLAVLIARSSLDDTTITDALARVQEARNQKNPAGEKDKGKEKPKKSPKEAQYCSSKGCAVCRRPVRGPQLLLCGNEDCAKPLYHDDCIRETALVPVENYHWRCNECYQA